MKTYRERGGLLGAVIGFTVPLIALLLRTLLPSKLEFLRLGLYQEVMEYPLYYAYMFLTVPLILGLFGYYLGHLRDRLARQYVSLERLNAILRNQSRTDDLTGQYNHRHVMSEIDKEIDRARRYQHVLSGMMVDLDGFKRVNDEHGHISGDEVLRQAAGVLVDSIRRIDILGRYGGDEFFIILPEADGNAAKTVAERLQRSMREHHFNVGMNYVALTISVGLCTFRDFTDVDTNAFVSKADSALLNAKRGGKDRIGVAA